MTDTIVRILNEMLATDPAAVSALISNRVPCNRALAEHPTIVVEERALWLPEPAYFVGLLGVLNGVAGLEDGRVAAVFNDDGMLIRFETQVAP